MWGHRWSVPLPVGSAALVAWGRGVAKRPAADMFPLQRDCPWPCHSSRHSESWLPLSHSLITGRELLAQVPKTSWHFNWCYFCLCREGSSHSSREGRRFQKEHKANPCKRSCAHVWPAIRRALRPGLLLIQERNRGAGFTSDSGVSSVPPLKSPKQVGVVAAALTSGETEPREAADLLEGDLFREGRGPGSHRGL